MTEPASPTTTTDPRERQIALLLLIVIPALFSTNIITAVP